MKAIAVLGVLAVGLFAQAVADKTADVQKPASKKQTIHVDEIGKSVVPVGRFGLPLGEIMTIRGTWTLPSGPVKDSSLRFFVKEVNGKKLDHEVELSLEQFETEVGSRRDVTLPAWEDRKTLDGHTWTLRGYEKGYIDDNICMARFDHSGDEDFHPIQMPVWTRTFTSEFVGVRVK